LQTVVTLFVRTSAWTSDSYATAIKLMLSPFMRMHSNLTAALYKSLTYLLTIKSWELMNRRQNRQPRR